MPWDGPQWEYLYGRSDTPPTPEQRAWNTRFRHLTVLFGDAGAAVVLRAQEGERGIVDQVLHTDGALKVQNEVGEEYGEPRLYEAVKKEAPKNSQAFVNFVGSAIDAFHVGTPQNDDITISTVKRLK